MRIAFVVNTFKKISFEKIARTLPRSVEYAVFDARDCFSAKGWSLPSRTFLRKLMDFGPEVVYTDYPHYPMWYAWLYQMLRKRKVARVAQLHGDWWNEFESWLTTAPAFERLFAVHRYYFSYTGLALADVITPVCCALTQVVSLHFPFKPTVEVYGGVDPDIFFEEPGVSLRHPSVCLIQNHIIWPKVRGLLQFASVVKRMPDVHFYITAGQRSKQPYAALVRRTFATFANVHMLEPVDHPAG